jgi:hypothetical protein
VSCFDISHNWNHHEITITIITIKTITIKTITKAFGRISTFSVDSRYVTPKCSFLYILNRLFIQNSFFKSTLDKNEWNLLFVTSKDQFEKNRNIKKFQVRIFHLSVEMVARPIFWSKSEMSNKNFFGRSPKCRTKNFLVEVRNVEQKSAKIKTVVNKM